MFPHSPTLNWTLYGCSEWPSPKTVDFVMGSFMLIRRAAVDSQVLLDDGYFMHAEEADLCWRLASKGWRTVYFPEVGIAHHYKASSSASPTATAWAHESTRRGTLRFLWQNRGPVRAYVGNALYLCALVPRCLFWAVADLRDGMRIRRLRFMRTKKTRVALFHLAVLFRPSRLGETWGPPHEM
jgi:GT2 family glycosyltransferase